MRRLLQTLSVTCALCLLTLPGRTDGGNYVFHHIYFYTSGSGTNDVTSTHSYSSGYLYDQTNAAVGTVDEAGGLHSWNAQSLGFIHQYTDHNPTP